jgi:peptidoglycan hydrolase-like protein with peptidoglycan-binding domain
MKRKNCVGATQALGASIMVCLALLCSPAVSVAAGSDSRTDAADRASALIARGAGYGQPQGDPRVRVLQRRLRDLGHQPGPVDGLYGPLTMAAVERLQHDSGLSVDGVVGPQTRRVLNAEAPPLAPGAGYGQPGGSEQVRDVQRRLRALGQRPGPVDGLYGPRTQAAIERFQRSAGQPAGGVLSPATAVALARVDGDASARRASDTHGDNDQRTRTPASGSEPFEAQEHGRQADGGKPAEGSDQSKSGAPKAADDSPEGKDGAEPTTLVVLAVLALALLAIGGVVVGFLKKRRRRPKDRPDTGSTATPSPEPSPRGHGAVALGYVSGLEPEPAEGKELLEQMAVIERLCHERGLALKEVVHDTKVTASLAERPGIRYAMQQLAVGEASCLVVVELGRLSRSVPEIGHILDWLRRRDLRLVAIEDRLDTATAVGARAVDKLVSLSTLNDRRGSSTQTGAPVPVRGERPPARANHGSRKHDVAALKERIQAMRATGMTLQAIADELNAEKVPTLRGGTEWRPSGVQAAAGYRRPAREPAESANGGERSDNAEERNGNGGEPTGNGSSGERPRRHASRRGGGGGR